MAAQGHPEDTGTAKVCLPRICLLTPLQGAVSHTSAPCRSQTHTACPLHVCSTRWVPFFVVNFNRQPCKAATHPALTSPSSVGYAASRSVPYPRVRLLALASIRPSSHELLAYAGVFGYPEVPATQTAVEAVLAWLADPANRDAMDLVVFDVFSDRLRAVYEEVLAGTSASTPTAK